MWIPWEHDWQELGDAYLHLVNHVVPGPQSMSYFVPVVLLPLGLLLPPSAMSSKQLSWSVVPVVGACSVHAWYAMGGVDVISFDTFLWTLFFYAYNDPRKDFKLISLSGTDEGYPSGLKSRLYWVGTLTASLRMHSWKIGIPKHDNKQHYPCKLPTRVQFCFRIMVHVGLSVILLCLTSRYLEQDPVLTRGVEVPDANPVFVRAIQTISPAIVRPMMLGLWSFAVLNLGYQIGLPNIVFANWLTGFPADEWSPHTMSPHYGSFTEDVLHQGLSGLWGIWWHQLMRQMIGTPGIAVANMLGLQTRSIVRYTIQVLFAFGLSGCTHAGMVPPYPLNTEFTASGLRLRVASFFWVQAFGIIFEVLVIQRLLTCLGTRCKTSSTISKKKCGRGEWRKQKFQFAIACLIRLSYVVAFLSLSIPLLYAPFRELGWLNIYPPPGLPHKIEHVLAGRWIP